MTCPACGRKDNTIFFCSDCWAELPGNERVALGRMHRKKWDATSKVAKCVRILKEKSTAANGLR